MSDVVEIHSSSGTTGKPVVGGYTRADLEMWTELVCRLVVAAGVRMTATSPRSPSATACSPAASACTTACSGPAPAVIPISAGNTARQIQFMKDFGTTVLISTPVVRAVPRRGGCRSAACRSSSSELRLGLFGAEACSEELRAQIEKPAAHHRRPTTTGSPRSRGPAWPASASAADGMHIAEDHFIVECLDPATGKPVADGEVGELVFTALTQRVLAGAALPHARPHVT